MAPAVPSPRRPAPPCPQAKTPPRVHQALVCLDPFCLVVPLASLVSWMPGSLELPTATPSHEAGGSLKLYRMSLLSKHIARFIRFPIRAWFYFPANNVCSTKATRNPNISVPIQLGLTRPAVCQSEAQVNDKRPLPLPPHLQRNTEGVPTKSWTTFVGACIDVAMKTIENQPSLLFLRFNSNTSLSAIRYQLLAMKLPTYKCSPFGSFWVRELNWSPLLGASRSFLPPCWSSGKGKGT